ncbi:MAG: hypothetical protein ACREAU_03180 [Nitrosopumilaceae archaeon]
MTTELKITLPDRPSELIRWGLKDLRACEEDPVYKIDMSAWHRPLVYDGIVRDCLVCLTGAVLAKTFLCPLANEFTPSMLEITDLPSIAYNSIFEVDILIKKLKALDHFRDGAISYAFATLGTPIPGGISSRVHIIRYADSQNKFYQNMEQLALTLEVAGA